MNSLYSKVCFSTSKLITKQYSTSFAIGVRCLHSSIRNAIYSIYGFVRLADEIVDTFHDFDKKKLLDDFEKEYYKAINDGISLNPVLNSFQQTVRQNNIDDELVQAFLKSMKSDLFNEKLDEDELIDYIYGSAEAVGLMCLKVFVKGDNSLYNELAPYAKRLGAAFQKVNFLRDLQHDTEALNRTYFPILKHRPLDESAKKIILDDINNDYHQAMIGIKKLPKESRLGVYIAYLYYKQLAKKIERTQAEKLMQQRISVPNSTKMGILCKAYVTSLITS